MKRRDKLLEYTRATSRRNQAGGVNRFLADRSMMNLVKEAKYTAIFCEGPAVGYRRTAKRKDIAAAGEACEIVSA